jgi:hypothetical protein
MTTMENGENGNSAEITIKRHPIFAILIYLLKTRSEYSLILFLLAEEPRYMPLLRLHMKALENCKKKQGDWNFGRCKKSGGSFEYYL